MWFKNLTVYHLPANWGVTTLDLNTALESHAIHPIPSNFTSISGWSTAFEGLPFVIGHVGQMLINLSVTEKSIPPTAVKQLAKARAKVVAEEQGFDVGKRQMREIKEAVLASLIPTAIPKTRTTAAWINREAGLLVVNTSSPKRAEEVVNALRDALGTFAAVPLGTARSPAVVTKEWLLYDNIKHTEFTIDDELHLQADGKIGASVKYSRGQLNSKEVDWHLQSKAVKAIGLTWSDKVAFVMTDQLILKKIQFLAVTEADAVEGDLSPDERFAIDFALMTGELTKLITGLVETLGGYLKPEPMTAIDD